LIDYDEVEGICESSISIHNCETGEEVVSCRSRRLKKYWKFKRIWSGGRVVSTELLEEGAF